MTTILLVDDEPSILAALKTGLERSLRDIEVLTASNGKAGLALLEGRAVDLILSDQKMPGMQGVDFLIASRKFAPTAIRMMLTAYPEEKLLERNVNEARIRHFFTKPYRLADLVGAIAKLTEEQRLHKDRALALSRAIEETRATLPASEAQGSGPA